MNPAPRTPPKGKRRGFESTMIVNWNDLERIQYDCGTIFETFSNDLKMFLTLETISDNFCNGLENYCTILNCSKTTLDDWGTMWNVFRTIFEWLRNNLEIVLTLEMISNNFYNGLEQPLYDSELF